MSGRNYTSIITIILAIIGIIVSVTIREIRCVFKLESLEVCSPANKLKEEAWDALIDYGIKGIPEAAKKFEKAKEIAPNDLHVLYGIGWLDDLNNALKDRPDYTPYGEPNCKYASERYAKALKLLEKKSPTDAFSKEMIIEIGHYLSNRDREHERAINLYNTHILTKGYDLSNPVTYLGLVSRGMAYFWNKEYGLAEKDFEEALTKKPSNEVVYNRGSIYAMSGDNYEQAIKWYKAAIYGGEIKLRHHNDREVQLPENLNFYKARRDLGFALLLNVPKGETAKARKERYEKARQEFEKATNSSDNYLAYVGLGIAQYFEGNVTDAVSSLNKIPEENDYHGLARIYLQKIEQCQEPGKITCINHFQEIEDLTDVSTKPILTPKGLSRVFGNVVVHEDEELNQILSLEHDAIYTGPCSQNDSE